MSAQGRSELLIRASMLLILCIVAQARYQRPSAAYAPLFTGLIKFTDVPAYGTAEAPPIIPPTGRKRRNDNFPIALELSSPVLERLYSGADGSSFGHRRRLHQQQQQQPQDYPQQQQQQHSAGSSKTDAAGSSSRSSKTRSRSRRLQQAAAGKQRPGWAGLWWADAGGVGVAAGPSHVVHTISTVMAVYTIEATTGAQGEPRVVALQDLFAPVGAANCKEGVYDAIPLYDKAAKRYVLAATCGGKGAVLLAATATADPLGPWFLFMLLADAAQTSMACSTPKETAIAESVRVTYDSNGVYLSMFNYCPSYPATQGAALLALPKHKVYKGAPNFVYAVYSADQMLEALPPDQRSSLSASSFKQCAAATPQLAADVAAGVAYFVCDQAGPDVSPRGNFTVLALVNTGALWQFAGTQPSSPTPFLTARLVDRGMDAPLHSTVMQQQPERGSNLQAGGVRPAGFWSGSAVVSNGKVYTVDRIDVTNATEPPGVAVTLPSLMWAEVTVQVSMSGAGDCTKTSAWGSNWDWDKDWSVDWGKDFDKEWKANKNDAATMKDHVDDLEDAIRRAQNCTAATPQQQQQQTNQVSDGSAVTANGTSSSSNCTLVEANGTNPDVRTEAGSGRRRLVGRAPEGWTDDADSSSSSSSSGVDWQQQSGTVSAALAAARAAAQCSKTPTEWMLLGRPRGSWELSGDSSSVPSWLAASDDTTGYHSLTDSAAHTPAAAGGDDDQAEGFEGMSGSSRHLSQVTLPGFINFDVGCWYCYYGKGFYYTSTWFYKYWYTRNAWGFGWYRRYKRNYAPGWSQPSKFIGHKRHLLDMTQRGQHPAAVWQHDRHLLDVQADVPSSINPKQLQNETIMVPPCLVNSTYYKNTCKQCNYTRLTVNVTVNATRRGYLSLTRSANPLGFVAPTIAVTTDGSIIIVAGYAGPNNHPNSSAPAYPGVGSFTIPPGASGTNATWKVLRTGVGKVKSPTGRWSDYSTSSVIITSSPSPVPGQPDVSTFKVYYGVQWAQREVECAADETEGDFEFEPTCAMPAPWIGVLSFPAA